MTGPREMEAEVLEEIRFHLDMATRENVAAGMDPEVAREEAEHRFGSVSEVVRGCIRAQMGGTIMLQKINFALVAILLVAVVFVGYTLVQVRQETSALRAALAPPADASSGGPAVYLLGKVNRPGSYLCRPADSMTLTKLIAAAGDFTQFANQSKITVIRKKEPGTSFSFTIDFGDILKQEKPDLPLQDGDLVFVPESIF